MAEESSLDQALARIMATTPTTPAATTALTASMAAATPETTVTLGGTPPLEEAAPVYAAPVAAPAYTTPAYTASATAPAYTVPAAAPAAASAYTAPAAAPAAAPLYGPDASLLWRGDNPNQYYRPNKGAAYTPITMESLKTDPAQYALLSYVANRPRQTQATSAYQNLLSQYDKTYG
jgi:hypothetical protein